MIQPWMNIAVITWVTTLKVISFATEAIAT